MQTTKYSFSACVLIAIIGSLQALSDHGSIATSGNKVENGTVSFSDDSSILMIIRKAPASKVHHLEFLFRTTLSDCAIVLGESEYGDTSSYSLGLYGGKLRLNSFYHDELNITGGENLSDGNWHKAFVSLNASHFTLGADGEIVSMATPSSEKQTGVNKIHIAFQGRKQHLGSYPSGGCIKNLQVNGQRLALDGANNGGYRVLTTNAKIGEKCVKVEQCRATSCQNGGTCVDLWNAFECKCPRTHHGATCQYPFTAAVFNHKDSPNSLALVDIPPKRVWNTAVVSLVLRTTQAKGTIIFLGNKSRGMKGNYFEAKVNDEGKLLVNRKWDSDGGKVESNDYGFVLNDGKAHLVRVWCSRDRFEMSVDGSSVSKRAFSTGAFNATVMYIGGKPDFLTSGQNGSKKTTGSKGDDGENNLSVPEKDRFVGTIRDVSVRLSLDPAYIAAEDDHNDPSKSTVYSVHFFNGTNEHAESGGQLGRVTTQNLRMQTLSDQDDYSPCGIEYHCRS